MKRRRRRSKTRKKMKYKTSKAVYMEVFTDYIKSQCKVTWLIFVATFFSPHLFAPPDSPLLKIPPLLPWSWGVSGWDLRSSGGTWSRWGDIPWRIFTKSQKIREMMNVLRMQCRPHPICSLIIRHSGTHSRERLWIFFRLAFYSLSWLSIFGLWWFF